MNTLEQLQELANQGKLAEIDTLCAEAQGWTFWPSIDGNKGYWIDQDGEIIIDYHPTADTDLGRSQAWQLAEKFNVSTIKLGNGNWEAGFSYQHKEPKMTQERRFVDVEHESLQVAVAMAAILAAQGEE